MKTKKKVSLNGICAKRSSTVAHKLLYPLREVVPTQIEFLTENDLFKEMEVVLPLKSSG